jgi:hypothetical protein
MDEELTPWQKYLDKIKKDGLIESSSAPENSKPWDLLNPNIKRAPDEIAEKRYSICQGCPKFNKFTTQCKICKCFMSQKVKLAHSFCPLHKWEVYNEEEDNGIL